MMAPSAGLPATEELTRFDLDFPGGPPVMLVEFISKAMNKPLNVIIPNELGDTALPALCMKQITVPQLFDALQTASRHTVSYVTGRNFPGGNTSYQQMVESFGFRAAGNQSATINDHTIWCFFNEKATPPPTPSPVELRKVCRFYQLEPYLGVYHIEDITTAIKTGWKMLGIDKGPEINFHQDTQLLIAVGQMEDLEIIDSVLKQLGTGLAGKTVKPEKLPPAVPGAPIPATIPGPPPPKF